MLVKEIMKTPVVTIASRQTAKEVAEIMHDKHIGSVPVVDDGKLVGIVTDRDICVRVTATGRDAVMTHVNEVMGKAVETCTADTDLDQAVKLMVDHRIRRLVVLDSSNAITGILSVDDLAKASHELASRVLEASIGVH